MHGLLHIVKMPNTVMALYFCYIAHPYSKKHQRRFCACVNTDSTVAPEVFLKVVSIETELQLLCVTVQLCKREPRMIQFVHFVFSPKNSLAAEYQGTTAQHVHHAR